MSTNAETKLRSIVGVRTGISIHRFPENIGSLSTDPESRKFLKERENKLNKEKKWQQEE